MLIEPIPSPKIHADRNSLVVTCDQYFLAIIPRPWVKTAQGTSSNPRAREAEETHAYSLEKISSMTTFFSEPASLCFCAAVVVDGAVPDKGCTYFIKFWLLAMVEHKSNK